MIVIVYMFLFLYYDCDCLYFMFVCEGADMNQTINEPDIAKDEPKVG
jgi:hypothetical protein